VIPRVRAYHLRRSSQIILKTLKSSLACSSHPNRLFFFSNMKKGRNLSIDRDITLPSAPTQSVNFLYFLHCHQGFHAQHSCDHIGFSLISFLAAKHYAIMHMCLKGIFQAIYMINFFCSLCYHLIYVDRQGLPKVL